MTKFYRLQYGVCDAWSEFEVDTEKFTKEVAQEILDFFMWDYDVDADPIDEVMKKIGMEVIIVSTYNSYNKKGVISVFNNNEGYCRLDGTDGVLLTEVSPYEFDDDDLTMSVL